MPKVSVIIPVYNTEQYLRECLDSVVNQTLKDIEIICVNDGSTDNSGRILEEYAEKDSRIKVIHKENTGSANSRNVGIEIATGEYLGFIDSDDYISKNYFQELYKSALNNMADIAMTSGVITWKDKKKKKKPCGVNKKQHLIESNSEKAKIIITTGVSCNKIYKKSFLQENNIKYLEIPSAAEDNYFTDIAIIKANKISVIHNATYNYVMRNTSLSQHKKTEKDFNCIDVYDAIEKYIVENISDKKIKDFWIKTITKRKQKDYVYHIDTMQPNCVEKFLVLIKKSLEKKLIVSLTSFPARINTVYKTIESLLNQTLKADAVILWLAEEQFPNKEKDLPKYLLELTKKGLTISWCEDIRSYKKLIPTLKQYPNDIIVTVDDDIIYNKDTLKNLYLTYLKNDNCIICHRAHYITFNWGKINSYSKWINCVNNYKKSSYNLFFTGCGAVLYPPNCLHKDIFNKDLFQKLAKDTDDIWFWAMAVLNNFKIKIAEKPILDLEYIDETQEQALYLNNCDGGNNDKNIKLILDYYPQILTKLAKENDIYKNNLEKIFSVRNILKTCHKVITICGLQIKLKSRKLKQKKQIQDLQKQLLKQGEDFKQYKQNIALELKAQNYKLHKYCAPEMRTVALADWYFEKTGEILNLDNPQTFNEKIQWMKLYDSTQLKTRLADKYLVREWVKEKIGEEYLIPLLGVWDNFDEIDFDKLPNQFVLKCNHGCGYNIIVKDKSNFDINEARGKINSWMREDFAFKGGFEMHYSDIPHKIIAEKYIENSNNDLYDYKVWCFNGKAHYIQFLTERYIDGIKTTFYDTKWNKLDFVNFLPRDTKTNPKPEKLDLLIQLCEKLAQGFNYVRIDFYITNEGCIYFGEMTFTPASGTHDWDPKSTNLKLGQLIELNRKGR